MSFPRVVAFLGPDGAGKSTQAELLAADLRSRGFKVKRAWVRSVHTFAFLLWRLFMRLHLCQDRSGLPMKNVRGFAVSYLSETSYGVVSPITMSPPVLNGWVSHKIWSVIEIASIIPVVLLQVYIPLFLGYVVVAERYVVDSIASIAYFLGDECFASSSMARFLLTFIPKGTLFVFVDADYRTILSRREKWAGAPDYTEFHRRMYEVLSRRVGAIYVDTSRLSIQQAHEKILNSIVTA